MSWVKTSDQAEAYQLELTVDEITGIKSIKDENRFTLLEIAHQRKNQSMLNYFYSIALDSLQQQFGEGFDKNLDPQTDDRLQHLLYWAIQCRQLDTVMLILNKYSHIIRLDNILNNGLTPLQMAADLNYNDLVETLLNRGSAIDSIVPGYFYHAGKTALHIAADHGHDEVVQILLHHKANVNPNDGSRRTPLSSAVDNGHHKIVKVLLDHGANVNVMDRYGNRRTPLSSAVDNDHNEIAKALLTLTLPGGYTAKEKNDAANALKNVVFDGADPSQLTAHMGPLSEGMLGSLYKALKKSEWSIAPRMSVSATKKQK